MGKNKKRSQKNKQAKVLKKRAVQKKNQKLSNAAKAKRKVPGMPGVPGGLPPHMRAMAENLSQFAMPIFEIAKPETPGQMNSLAVLVQSFWKAYEEQDLNTRSEALTQTEEIFKTQSWANEIEFEKLSTILLQRHIVLSPKTHSEEELTRFSPEELQSAMAFSAEDLVSETEEVTTEVETAKVEKAPFEPELSVAIGYDGEYVKADVLKVLGDQQIAFIAEHEKFKNTHSELDFLKTDDPKLNELSTFHEQYSSLFSTFLKENGVNGRQARTAERLLNAFSNDYLKNSHQKTVFNVSADDVEEFIMDFYLRKMDRNENSDKLIIDTFRQFAKFMNAFESNENTAEILETIDEIMEEFEEEAAL